MMNTHTDFVIYAVSSQILKFTSRPASTAKETAVMIDNFAPLLRFLIILKCEMKQSDTRWGES